MLSYKFHTDLESLPIWQWNRCVKDNDVRYLLKLKDYDRLPKIHKYAQRDLIRVYADLVGQLDEIKNPIIEARKKVIIRLIDIVIEIASKSKDIEKIEKASIILRALMINPSYEDFIWNVDFTETSDQKQLLTQLAIDVRKYNEKVKKQEERKHQSLFDNIATIETMLGVNIDPKKCSVGQYMAYSKLARKKMSKKILN